MSELMQRPRITDEHIALAAKRLADGCNNLSDEEKARLTADLVKVRPSRIDNGYDIAKKLDNEGWDIDALFVEALDSYSYELDHVHEEACKKWAQENNIRPPLPIGTLTTKGEITGICEFRAASYLVKAPGTDDEKTGFRRLVVKFEDAVAA